MPSVRPDLANSEHKHESSSTGCGWAFNRTRQIFLATRLLVADTHWRRFRGLIGTRCGEFQPGAGLWISPCQGVHTFFMSYPIDVIYLSPANRVMRVDQAVRPWRMTPLLLKASTVIELPAHTAETTGTTLGDEIEIRVGGGEVDSK